MEIQRNSVTVFIMNVSFHNSQEYTNKDYCHACDLELDTHLTSVLTILSLRVKLQLVNLLARDLAAPIACGVSFFRKTTAAAALSTACSLSAGRSRVASPNRWSITVSWSPMNDAFDSNFESRCCLARLVVRLACRARSTSRSRGAATSAVRWSMCAIRR